MTKLADEHDPILVPVDFSECAADALKLAGEIAQCKSSPLVVLHVVHGTFDHMDTYVVKDAVQAHSCIPMREVARDRLREMMDELAEQNPELEALQHVRTVLVDGIPVNRILEVAEREGAGMIVIGSHGRTGLSRLVVGSVAEAITRKSPVPVTVVKETNGAAQAA